MHAYLIRRILATIPVMVVVALPMGVALGLGLILLMVSNFETELFRIPAIVAPATYGIAMIVTLVASTVCGIIVHQRIAHLDLIRVLKTRE